eukprot:TRINITY_DN1054_c8_g1_i1.p1 TRINITY_DN1054_c8_g1~~TRINITY_DN1054_c8_g1_i1.p1  ORF type:complete len:1120 (-),score=247.43 TRINITY_DN1054_c8_g1_i1:82-3441(-)
MERTGGTHSNNLGSSNPVAITDLLRREVDILNEQLRVKDEQLRALTTLLEARERDARDKDALLLDTFFTGGIGGDKAGDRLSGGRAAGRAGIGMAFLKRIEELEGALQRTTAEVKQLRDEKEASSTVSPATPTKGGQSLPQPSAKPLPPTPASPTQDSANAEKIRQLEVVLAKTVERLGGVERMLASYYKHESDKKSPPSKSGDDTNSPVPLSREVVTSGMRQAQLSPRPHSVSSALISPLKLESEAASAQTPSTASTSPTPTPTSASPLTPINATVEALLLDKKTRRYTVDMSSPAYKKRAQFERQGSGKIASQHNGEGGASGAGTSGGGAGGGAGGIDPQGGVVVSADSPIHDLLREGGLLMDVEMKLTAKPDEINVREVLNSATSTPTSTSGDLVDQTAVDGTLGKVVGGETPLIALCQSRTGVVRNDVLRFLLSFPGIDIDAVDNAGRNALHAACQQLEGNNWEVIQALIKQGIEVKRYDKAGYLPLHYFVRQNPKSYSIESWKKTFDIFLERLPIDIPCKNGETVLHHAAQFSSVAVFTILLERRASGMNLANKEGETPLHAAIKGRNINIINKMFELGVDPRIPASADQKTPMQLARSIGVTGKQTYDLIKSQVHALDMKGMNAEEKKAYRRNLAVEEIVETEKEYLEDLDILIKVFMLPLKKNLTEAKPSQRILGPEQFRNIFSSIEDIREVSSRVYQSLKHEYERGSENALIGKAMLDNMNDLQVYERVCMRQQSSTEFMQHALEGPQQQPVSSARNTLRKGLIGDTALPILKKREPEKTEFAKFCEKAAKVPECRQMDISSFLFKPFQRCTKYPLLIKELLSYTTEQHPDYRNLVKVQESLSSIIDAANEKKRATEELYKLLEIQNSIFWEGEMVKLGSKERRPITETPVHLGIGNDKVTKHYIFVLSDMLLVTKPIKKRKLRERAGAGTIPPAAKYSFKVRLNYMNCRIEDLNVPKPSFVVFDAKQNIKLTFVPGSAEIKQELLRSIENAITKHKETEKPSQTVAKGKPKKKDSATDETQSTPNESEKDKAKEKATGKDKDKDKEKEGNPPAADVLYAFTADFKNALQLKPGDVVSVLEQDKEGDGWWLGELNGKQGFFPATHVRLRPS